MRFFLTELKPEMASDLIDLFHNFPESEFGISYPEINMTEQSLQNHIKNEQNLLKYLKKFVFYYENVPVGFATFVSENFDKNLDCKVVSVGFCIRESYRGFGLGNLILNKLVSKAFEMQYSALSCSVQADNEKAKKVLHINNFKKQETPSTQNKQLDTYFLKLKL